MLLYHYDDNGVLTKIAEAKLDPEETKVQKGPFYLVPRNATELAPPEVPDKDGLIPVFDGSIWEVVEDHRGPVWVKQGGEEVEWVLPGPLPDEYTKLEPPAPPFKWGGDAWEPVNPQHIADLLRMEALRRRAVDELIVSGSVEVSTRTEFITVKARIDAG